MADLRELPIKWRRWAGAMRNIRQANRVLECADELERALAAQPAPAGEVAQAEEGRLFEAWFVGEQGKAYHGMWEFARAAWMARAAAAVAKVPEGLATVLNEAAGVLCDVATSGATLPASWRWPLADELSGFAAMLAAAPQPPAVRESLTAPQPEAACTCPSGTSTQFRVTDMACPQYGEPTASSPESPDSSFSEARAGADDEENDDAH